MTKDLLLLERFDAVAVVILNRPHAMNALSRDLRIALAHRIGELDREPDVHAIVLTGAGDRAFSGGLDLKELGETQGSVVEAVAPDPDINPVAAMAICKTPIIGAVNGVAITGGFELALACDILICSDNARFGDTHVKVGLMPGWGLSQKLPRIIGASRAKELSLSGRLLDAPTALNWGLVNRVVPAPILRDEAITLAQTISDNDSGTVQSYKSLINEGAELPMNAALMLEIERSQAFNATVGAHEIKARQDARQQAVRSTQ